MQAKPTCVHRAGWQKLADRVKVTVYCPAWLPDPLIGQIGGRWNNIDSVSKDRSYLESFVWQETGGGAAGGELHVNLRAYPGRSTIPYGPMRSLSPSASLCSALIRSAAPLNSVTR